MAIYSGVGINLTVLLLASVFFAVITNKLNGMMLTSIISAVDGHFIPKGEQYDNVCSQKSSPSVPGLHQQGADILETLTQVQRFGMVSMFLSSAEKKSK